MQRIDTGSLHVLRIMMHIQTFNDLDITFITKYVNVGL